MHGHVSVDDVRGGRRGIQPELGENGGDDFVVVEVAVVGVLRLVVAGGILDEVALERGHALLAVERGIFVRPHEPHGVLPEALFVAVGKVVALARPALQFLKQRPAAEPLVADLHFFKRPVLLQRHAAVVKQIAVAGAVHAAAVEEVGDVTAQLFAVDEGVAQLLHDHLLPRRQTVGILGVDGREVGVLQGIRLSVDRDRPILEVDLVQQAALLHVVFGMARDELTFQLKEDDRDRLVDLAVHVRIVWLVALRAVDGKAVAGIARIGIERKLGKGQQVDAVPVLHRIEIAVLCRDAHDGRDAREAPARRTHPADIVIAPLEIDIVEA